MLENDNLIGQENQVLNFTAIYLRPILLSLVFYS